MNLIREELVSLEEKSEKVERGNYQGLIEVKPNIKEYDFGERVYRENREKQVIKLSGDVMVGFEKDMKHWIMCGWTKWIKCR